MCPLLKGLCVAPRWARKWETPAKSSGERGSPVGHSCFGGCIRAIFHTPSTAGQESACARDLLAACHARGRSRRAHTSMRLSCTAYACTHVCGVPGPHARVSMRTSRAWEPPKPKPSRAARNALRKPNLHVGQGPGLAPRYACRRATHARHGKRACACNVGPRRPGRMQQHPETHDGARARGIAGGMPRARTETTRAHKHARTCHVQPNGGTTVPSHSRC